MEAMTQLMNLREASADVRHRQAICLFMQSLSEGGAVITIYRDFTPINKDKLH